MHTVKYFQVLLSNINSSICIQLNGFKYFYLTLIILFCRNAVGIFYPYWQGKSCVLCWKYQDAHRCEPQQLHDNPSGPWKFIASDLLTIDRWQYLLTISRYWKEPIVIEIPKPIIIKIEADKIKSYPSLFDVKMKKWWTMIRSTQNKPSKVLSYLPTPPLGQDMTQGQFLSGV